MECECTETETIDCYGIPLKFIVCDCPEED